MGFPPVESLSVTGFELDAGRLPIGGDLGFTFTVRHSGAVSARLAIDYIVHYVKANGTTAGKVFKLSVRDLDGGQDLALAKRSSRAAGWRPSSAPPTRASIAWCA